jgi:6-phosphogluconolactonase/glucosamine-6-phosphate isomerase/deaminase
VPFYLRTGKRMASRSAEITINFKPIPYSIFGQSQGPMRSNRLVITLQPEESVQLFMKAKEPGEGIRLSDVALNLDFAEASNLRRVESYERLLLDAMHGDLTLFVRDDELNAAWSWIDPIMNAWQNDSEGLKSYIAGSWGPQRPVICWRSTALRGAKNTLKADAMSTIRYHDFDDIDTLSASLSQQWLDIIHSATTPVSFALAGGTTPAPVYRRLDALLNASTTPHQPVTLVATDERWVDDDDAQSNEGLFRRCLPLSAAKQHWQLLSLKNTAPTPAAATAAIDARLREQLPQAFSAVLLGMGADGHIASLFPGAPVQQDQRTCLAALHPQTQQSRMSLSLPRLLNTERIWLLMTGAEKRRVLEDAEQQQLPISALLRDAGCPIDVFWCP